MNNKKRRSVRTYSWQNGALTIEKELKDLALKNGYQVIKILLQKPVKLKRILENMTKLNCLFHFVKSLRKLSKCNVLLEDKNKLLTKIYNSSFIKSLEIHFNKLPHCSSEEKMRNMPFWDNIEEFWFNICAFYNLMIETSNIIDKKKLCELVHLNLNCLERLQELQQMTLPEEIFNSLNIIEEMLKPSSPIEFVCLVW